MSDKNNGKISILMGIYNCASTLDEAVGCILAQTYGNWELIMCDDGSSDNTYSTALVYKNKYPDKVVLLKNEENKGLNFTLNKCLNAATGEYIARMDGDDRCSPDRFEKELAVLQNEPEISIVSTDMTFFDESGEWGRISHPEYPVNTDFVKETPFCHAPCLVRKEAYDKVGGYTVAKKLLRVEDYHLWIKMYEAGYKGKNIHEPLYQMRDDQNAYSRRKFKYRLNEAYVKRYAVKHLKLPKKYLLHSFKPVIVGLLPKKIYDKLHKKRLNEAKK